MAHGRAAVGVVHRLIRAERPVRLQLMPLCTWRERPRRAPRQRSARGGRHRRRLRLRGRVPCRRRWTGRRAASGTAASARARRRRAGSTTARTSGRRARSRAELAPGGVARGDGGRGAVRGELPAPAEIVAAARARAVDAARDGRRDGRVDAQLVLAADQFVDHDRGAADRCRRLPVVRRVVARLMTSYEGLYLSTNRATRGGRCCARLRQRCPRACSRIPPTPGSLEYNTVDGDAVVPPRDRPARRRAPATTTSAPSWRRSSSRSSQHHVDGTRFGIGVDLGDGLLRQGAEGWALTWMDARIDGVPGHRRGRASRRGRTRSGSRGSRSPPACAAERRLAAALVALAAQARPRSARFVRAGRQRAATTSSTAPGGDDAAVRPTSSSRSSLPHARSPASGDPARAVERLPRELLTPLGLRSPRRRTTRLPAAPPRRAGRARRRLPPGHRLAVADRPLRRRRAPRGRPRRGASRRHRGAHRRLGPRIDLGDGRRCAAARRHRVSLPGLVRRRGPTRPPCGRGRVDCGDASQNRGQRMRPLASTPARRCRFAGGRGRG